MTYDLYLGDRSYSSWSLRGWLLFEKFNLPVTTHYVDFAADSVEAQLAVAAAPARTVPTLVIDGKTVVSESASIAEELASRHPDAGIWPSDPHHRAIARSLAAEMASSFGPLRNDCPMNLRVAYRNVPTSEEVEANLRRLEKIWDYARAETASATPWLCGAYSAADAFYAPVAMRIAGYGLNVSASAQAYVEAHLNDLAFRRWRAIGMASGQVLEWYKRDYDQTTWPGPSPLPARAIADGTAENAACPYSGKPSEYLAEIDGRVFGFCNAGCRDKTVVDAEAFEGFAKIYRS